jgi:hypothetical protein
MINETTSLSLETVVVLTVDFPGLLNNVAEVNSVKVRKKMTVVNEHDSRAYEEEHVHRVYQQIAPHFSSTRYKVSHVKRTFLGLFCLLVIAVAHSRSFPTSPRTWVGWTRRGVRKWQVSRCESGHLHRCLG